MVAHDSALASTSTVCFRPATSGRTPPGDKVSPAWLPVSSDTIMRLEIRLLSLHVGLPGGPIPEIETFVPGRAHVVNEWLARLDLDQDQVVVEVLPHLDERLGVHHQGDPHGAFAEIGRLPVGAPPRAQVPGEHARAVGAPAPADADADDQRARLV